MSLVHQALRKAQQEKMRKSLVVPGEAFAPSPVPTALPMGQTPAKRVEATPAAAETKAKANSTLTGMLPVLLSSVAFVAMVAIVILVLNFSRGERGAREGTPSVQDLRSHAARGNEESGGREATIPEPRAAISPMARHPATVEAATPTSSEQPSPALPTAVSTVESQFRLTGIMKLPDGTDVAVINDRVVRVGHYVDGAVIKSIERDRVTMEVNGQPVVKRLY